MAFLCPTGGARPGNERRRSEENTTSTAKYRGADRFESEAMFHSDGEIGPGPERGLSLGDREWTPHALRRTCRIFDFR